MDGAKDGKETSSSERLVNLFEDGISTIPVKKQDQSSALYDVTSPSGLTISLSNWRRVHFPKKNKTSSNNVYLTHFSDLNVNSTSTGRPSTEAFWRVQESRTKSKSTWNSRFDESWFGRRLLNCKMSVKIWQKKKRFLHSKNAMTSNSLMLDFEFKIFAF